MLPRILSIAAPLFVYVTLALLVRGLWEERKKFDWIALVLAAAGLLVSLTLLDPAHRLFFDEDTYINIASNLTKAPVAQVTLLGGPDQVAVSAYYKEPAGWPVLLSLVFFFTGASEQVAFFVARIFYGLTLAAVYMLSLTALQSRRQALIAAILVGATPAFFWSSASTGLDIPAALFVVLGLLGIFAGNAPLAAAGFAMAAQLRLELIILAPIVLLAPKIATRWKVAAAGLLAAEAAHVAWVLSIAPEFARAVRVESAFSPQYAAQNVASNVKYLFNPLLFPAVITGLAIFSLFRKRPGKWPRWPLVFSVVAVSGVYAAFYVGSFEINPRYSIQILAPLALLAASTIRRPVLVAAVIASLAIPQFGGYSVPAFVQALEADHRIATGFASRVGSEDLVLSAQQEMFLNQGLRAMNSVLASEQAERLNEQLKQRKVWYHSGARTSLANSQDWEADQWVKSNYELRLIESHEAGSMKVAFYEIMKPVGR